MICRDTQHWSVDTKHLFIIHDQRLPFACKTSHQCDLFGLWTRNVRGLRLHFSMSDILQPQQPVLQQFSCILAELVRDEISETLDFVAWVKVSACSRLQRLSSGFAFFTASTAFALQYATLHPHRSQGCHSHHSKTRRHRLPFRHAVGFQLQHSLRLHRQQLLSRDNLAV